MKKFTIFLLFIFAFTNLKAQNYQIDFTGSGQSTTIDSVLVLNTVQNTTITILGGDVLSLLGTVDITSFRKADSRLNVYPNPISEKAEIEFFNTVEGQVSIEIVDMTGKTVSLCTKILGYGIHIFEMSGLSAGVYSINIFAPEARYNTKVISTNKTSGKVNIKYISSKAVSLSQFVVKSGKATVPMQYNDGEMLQLTAFSGNYSTLSTLIPTQSQTLNFAFASCADADSNSYTVVTIGTQIWMAENLKTTQYNDATPIPLVTVNNDWAALLTPAYCWQQNDINNKDIYGALYNWFVVDTLSNGNRNPCPTGWHVPDSAEWRVLIAFAGGETTGGCKLKATGNTTDLTGLWWTPNICATNETGFSALPANERSATSGSFYPLGVNADFWGTTDMGGTGDSAFDVFLNYNQQYVTGSGGVKKRGYSVRCIKD